MSTLKSFLALALTCAVVLCAAPRVDASAAATQQQQYGSIERGWRTGYSDGYQVGWQDSLQRRESNYANKAEYERADRAYVAAYGSLEDYRDGYRQGFEYGYGEGFARRGFNSDLPAGGVRRRGSTSDEGAAVTRRAEPRAGRVDDDDDDDDDDRGAARTAGVGARAIPRDTVMRVELLNRLSTDVSQRGDRFEARVVEPQEYEGAIIAGRVTSVERSGKVRGRSQLQLNFEQIRMPGEEWTEFSAQVIEVMRGAYDDGEAGEVDAEGGVRGRSTTKDDVAKVGAATGIGAIIGAIAGGGKGAAIGAVIGAGVGTGGVVSQRGQDIRLESGQQLRIRTSGRR
jgi:hypothetical protein